MISKIIKNKFILFFIIYTVIVFILSKLLPTDLLIDKIKTSDLSSTIIGLSFVMAYIIRGFFLFPTLFFLITISLLLNPVVAIFYYLLGIVLSGTLSYHIGKFTYEKNLFPKISKKINKNKQTKDKIRRQGLKGVFLFHVTGIALDVPNYFSGYFNLKFPKFILVIILANTITVFLYYVFIFNFINNIKF